MDYIIPFSHSQSTPVTWNKKTDDFSFGQLVKKWLFSKMMAPAFSFSYWLNFYLKFKTPLKDYFLPITITHMRFFVFFFPCNKLHVENNLNNLTKINFLFFKRSVRFSSAPSLLSKNISISQNWLKNYRSGLINPMHKDKNHLLHESSILRYSSSHRDFVFEKGISTLVF